MRAFYKYIQASKNQYSLRHQIGKHRQHYSLASNQLQESDAWNLPSGQFIKMERPNSEEVTHQCNPNNRKSSRKWDANGLRMSHLSNILNFSMGYKNYEKRQRYVARAGNLESCRAHIISRNCKGLENGIYTYDPVRHGLIERMKADLTVWLGKHVFFQNEFSNSSVMIFIESNYTILEKKYGEKALKLALLDAGHISHAIYVEASKESVGVCATAGFYEHSIEKALHIEESVSGINLCLCLG